MKRDFITFSVLSAGVIADIQSKVKIGKVFKGYFSSPVNAKTFTQIGLPHIASILPAELKLADFGGGDGYLTCEVKNFLEKHNKIVEGIVIDGNPNFLEEAAKKGFITLEASLEETKLKNIDLIIMRAVLHYNSKAVQKKILRKVKSALTNEGIFIHQLSSGDYYNVQLRNKIAHLPSLKRINDTGDIHFTTVDEYLALCKSVNLSTKLIGYAPESSWTLEEMFDRFHPETQGMTKEQKSDYRDRKSFLREAKELILHYKETTPIKGIEINNNTITVCHSYPIFESRLHPF